MDGSDTYIPKARKRFGPETAAGLRVLEAIRAEQAQAHADSAAEAKPQKRRKTRWAPQEAVTTVTVPGIAGVPLPQNIAALAQSIDEGSTALQHELIRVRPIWLPCAPWASDTCCAARTLLSSRSVMLAWASKHRSRSQGLRSLAAQMHVAIVGLLACCGLAAGPPSEPGIITASKLSHARRAAAFTQHACTTASVLARRAASRTAVLVHLSPYTVCHATYKQAALVSRLQVNMRLQLIAQGTWVDETPSEQRSPSPEPRYDASGNRTNTRPLRAKERLQARRDAIIEELVKTCPGYSPPLGWRPPRRSAKLYLPAKEHPHQSYIGLILGPRGKNQQEMEQTTGARIAIRCAFGCHV